jgi:hypothetical protein
MKTFRLIGTASDPLAPLGDALADSFTTGTHDLLVSTGAYDLPPGYIFVEETLSVYSPKGLDDFRTARVRQAVAQEKSVARAMQIRAEALAKIEAAHAANLAAARPAAAVDYAPATYSAPMYAAPLSTLPAPVAPAYAAPAADPVTTQQQQEALAAAQAASLVAQYAPAPAAARSYASQLLAAGQSGAAGQWLDYAGQLEQWLINLKTTYNVA